MMLHTIRTKALSLLLALAMLAGLLPGLRLTAQADSFDFLTLKPTGSENATELTAKQVTFNGVKWYVIDYDSAAQTATLFATQDIGSKRFDDNSSDYKGSEIENYLNSLTAKGGSYYNVAPAILGTDLADVGVTSARLYLLSEGELNTMPKNIRRTSLTDSDWKNYWLRAKGPNTWTGTPQAKNCYPAAWTGTPLVGEAVVTDSSKLVRPALKLNLNRVDYDQSTKTFTVAEPVERTVTFAVENGAWDDGTTENKTVTLQGYPRELKLSSNDIPAVGAKPLDHTYKAGSWNVTPDNTTVITGNNTYTYSYAKKDEISYTVTFHVDNGAWNDDTTDDITVTLEGLEGDTLKLAANQIPGVGEKPGAGHKAGTWNNVPDATTPITNDTTYTYTYQELGKISATVIFKVVHGSWDDGTSKNRTVNLEGVEGAKLKLAAGDIPSAGEKPDEGYAKGSWDVTPSAETAIQETITYTYTYAARTPIRRTVTFKVVNGSWDNESSEDITITLTGYEGDTLKLTAEQIPTVGNKPDNAFKAGSWDTEPSPKTEITAEQTTYTYTYAARVLGDYIRDLIPTESDSGDALTAKQVYFNGYKWYIINYDEAQNTATLFAAEKIGNDHSFDGWTNKYNDSAIKAHLDSMTAEGGLFEGAAHNIKPTNLPDTNVEGAYLFLLSTAEAEKIPVNVRVFEANYYLRSPFLTSAVEVYSNGTINGLGSSVQFSKAIRPALTIDLSKTAFAKEESNTYFKTKQSVTAPTGASKLAYTGESLELLSSPATVRSGNKAVGAITYSLSLDNPSWSADIPAATNPGEYRVYYKVADNDGFDAFESAEPVTVTIDKADPVTPSGLTATYGQTLNDIALPVGWTWAEPNASVGNAGTKTFSANYTPSDDIHKEVNNYSVLVTVNKTNQTVPDAPTALTIKPLSITLEEIENGEYSRNGTTWQASPTFLDLTENTEYTFYQRLKEDANHNASPVSAPATIKTTVHRHEWRYTADGATITVTCDNTDEGHVGDSSATLTVSAPALTVYGGTESPEATVTGSMDGVDTPAVVYKKGTETLAGAPTGAGTYTANITLGDQTASVEYTIDKAAAAVTAAPIAKTGLVENGTAQALVEAGSAEGGTMQYALGEDGTTAPESGFADAIPTGTDAGTYYVWYKVIGDNKHDDTAPACISVTVTEVTSVFTNQSGTVVMLTYPYANTIILCSAYDENGKQVGVEIVPVETEKFIYTFAFTSAYSVKAFLLDEAYRPLCKAKQATIVESA